MITFEIGGKDYELPEGWDEVSLEKFEKIVKHGSILSEYKSKILYAIELIAILLDAPVDDITRLDRPSYEILAEKCSWANGVPKTRMVKKWNINDVEYIAFEELNKLTMGDSVSLELMINESNEQNVISNILPILVRKAKKVMRDGKEVLEPGEFDADNYEKTKELFRKHMMISDVIWIKDFFLDGAKASSITMKATSEKGSQKRKMMKK